MFTKSVYVWTKKTSCPDFKILIYTHRVLQAGYNKQQDFICLKYVKLSAVRKQLIY